MNEFSKIKNVSDQFNFTKNVAMCKWSKSMIIYADTQLNTEKDTNPAMMNPGSKWCLGNVNMDTPM